MITKIEASALAVKALKAFWAADRANVYVNPRDVFFTVHARLPRFAGEYLTFTPIIKTETIGKLNAYGKRDKNGYVICDGATAAPDWPRGVRPATGLHDPGYLEMERIAEAWKNEPFERGGKFDWIADNRNATRELHHINGSTPYSNWQSSWIPNPAESCFVLVSMSGRRSNVIKGRWQR